MPDKEESHEPSEMPPRVATAEARQSFRPAVDNRRRGQFVNHLTEDIRTSVFAELQLVILTFCTGIQGEHTGHTISAEA